MKLLILDQFSDPGGAQLCLRDLLPEMLRRGWKPQLMAPGNGLLVEWCRRRGVPAHELPGQRYSNGRKTLTDFLRFAVDAPRAALAVRAIVQRERIDAVYVNGPRMLPAAVGLTCPIVFHAHHQVKGWASRKMTQTVLAGVNASVIAVSSHVAAAYPRARVVYNGVPDLRIGVRNFRRRIPRVGMLGRIAPEKGQLDFVRAAKRLANSGVAAEFFIYGSKLFSEAAYEERVRSTAEGAVVICGWADDIAAVLHNVEILVVPSGPGEGATRVIPEAFSAGTPVVAYRSGGIPEIVDHGRTGLLTERADAESLAAAIRRLVGDRELMESLSAGGRKEWEQRFKVEQFRSSVCDLLERRRQSTTEEPRGEWGRASGGDAVRGA